MAEAFDLESVYDEQIAPLMTQIIEICKRHALPMAATFEYASDDFCTTTIPCENRASDHMLRVCAVMQNGQHQENILILRPPTSGHMLG